MARIIMPSFNPVALREMKSRVRGPRTLALFFVYLAVLAVFIFVVYLRKGANTTYSYGGTLLSGNYGPTRNFETGQDIFLSIFLYLILMVAVVTPAVCGGLVSREMEEGTYDLLVVTPVKGRTLVYGKLIGSVGYLFMLILATLPLTCIVFIFGGVGPEDVAAGYAIVLMETVVFSIISLFFSAVFRLTNVAIIFTYFVIALLLLGVPVASSSLVASINADTTRPSANGFRVDPRTDPDFDFPKRLLVLNPFASLGSVLAPNAPYRPSSSEDLQLFPNSRLYWGNPTVYYGTPTYIPNSNSRIRYEESKLPVLPYGFSLWQGYLLVYAALGVVFLLLGTGAVKPLPGGIIYAPAKGISALKKATASKKDRTTVAAGSATTRVAGIKTRKAKKAPDPAPVTAPLAVIATGPAIRAKTAETPAIIENSVIEAATEARTAQNKIEGAFFSLQPAPAGVMIAPDSPGPGPVPGLDAGLIPAHAVESSARVQTQPEDSGAAIKKSPEVETPGEIASAPAEATLHLPHREVLG